MSKWIKMNKKMKESVVGGCKKIEKSVVSGYKKVESNPVEFF